MNAAYLTPAITLFNEDGSLDLVSQEKLFNSLIENGIDGILVEGSSSEFFAMPMDQRREMAKFAIEAVDHWIAFGLLSIVGANMIKEALEESETPPDPDLSVKAMLPLAVATSIDALAVGVSLAMTAVVSIWTAVALIGLTTFLLSGAGAWMGGVFGRKYEKKAEIFGGVILILLGLKILLENLGVL